MLWLVAAILLRGRRASLLPWLFLLLAAGLSGFLAGNTGFPVLVLSGPAAAAASLLSGCAAAFVWWFCLAIFDDDFRLGRFAWGVGALWIIVAILDRGARLFPGFPDLELSRGLIVIAAGMVAHLAWHLLRDREGDLVESRRRARWWLVAILATLLLVDVGVDLVMGFEWKPPWFALLQNAAIGAFAAFMARWLLRVDLDALQFRAAPASADGRSGPVATPVPAVAVLTPAASTAGPGANVQDAAEARLLRRLHDLVEVERIHRDPALTFADFARRMGAPEPAVRRLVNQTLGHRHFRTFLNAYRVADARAALADPARSRQKLIAIAFDCGFSSLASFNRAFKDIVGRAPSEFRADAS